MNPKLALLLLCCALALPFKGNSQSPKVFPKADVLEDLDFLKASLEEAHYDLHAYTPKAAFDRNFEAVKASIQADSFSLLEATSLFQRVVSKADNGHTEIPFPGAAYREHAFGGGTLFPLEIAFEGGKALVRKNWSGNDRIPIGSEVLGINGTPMGDLLERIYPQVSAERPYFKNAKIELYSFPRLYWQVFGQQDEFDVEIRANGAVETFTLEAVSVIDGYEMKRKEVLNAHLDLKFYEKAAYVNPGSFGGDPQHYRKFIDSAFAVIRDRKPENLILDLRNNAGGDNAFSDYLVSYIADKPFRWNSAFTLKTSKFLKQHVRQHNDTTTAYWREALAREDGEVYPFAFDPYPPQPKEKRFAGKVYVLINRQSHSQAAVTAAQIQDYGFATLAGEETGDYPSLYASQFQFALPQTGIPVKVSKGYIVRVNGSTKEEGVIPDIFIRDHLLDETDEILEGLLHHLE
ncbi:S41 family peptidase [Robiginitalea marina]|uniref:S41 family peptidase n=1 Tax=Robiginitalea marina TaxID=2954105 RepID=A0ABT1B0I7_9FLAO|nr:S41 family peptidase [Robiginitalea marina]MCO5725762.1 S41 family peptidase [Robiginitalea marina]